MLLAEQGQLHLNKRQGPQVDRVPKNVVEHPWFPTVIEVAELSQMDIRGDALWIL